MIFGTQSHFWEMGWRYIYTVLKGSAVARTGGTGWAAGQAGRVWDAAMELQYERGWEKTRSRLWPLDSV